MNNITFIRLLIILFYLISFINGKEKSNKEIVCENQYNYYQGKREKILKKLREKKEKLRVCFLVSENEKWNAQSLYDMMEKSEDFYPFLVVTRLKNIDGRTSFKHNLENFKKYAKNVEIGFDEKTNHAINLRKFKPDIVFYQQPWDIYKNQNPEYILDFALSYYFPYGIGSVNPVLKMKWNSFYIVLQKHFVFSEAEKQQCMDFCKYVEANTSVVGHPKIDYYIDNNIENTNVQKKYVIYAPHHSFNNRSLLHFGTFDWNGKFILKWAKSHPELNWVFKPHPFFKKILLSTRFMKKNEIDEYYKEWADLGIYYDDGNYFDFFKNSTCLITDCHSFLTEYFPTKNPVIHLRNPRGTQYSVNNKLIIKTYNDVWNITQLENTLEDILINGHDPKKEERLSLLNKMNIGKENSAIKIIRDLKKDFWRFKTILIYGTFDILSYEQIEVLKKAKELGKVLIVGLSTDEFNKNIKEKSFYHTYEQRKSILENNKYVDLIIPENNWDQKISDINKYNVDVLVLEGEWPSKFDFMNNYCEDVNLDEPPNFCIVKRKNI